MRAGAHAEDRRCRLPSAPGCSACFSGTCRCPYRNRGGGEATGPWHGRTQAGPCSCPSAPKVFRGFVRNLPPRRIGTTRSRPGALLHKRATPRWHGVARGRPSACQGPASTGRRLQASRLSPDVLLAMRNRASMPSSQTRWHAVRRYVAPRPSWRPATRGRRSPRSGACASNTRRTRSPIRKPPAPEVPRIPRLPQPIKRAHNNHAPCAAPRMRSTHPANT